MKPLYISTFSFYLGYNNLIFAIGAGTSLIYLILILIFFTEPSKGTMLNQYRAIQKQKIEEDDAKKDLLDDEKNLCDYKELYDENETGDDTQKLNNLLFRESEEIEQLKVGFHSFTDKNLVKEPGETQDYITLKSLREVANELNEVINDEELKEMMVQANPELKNLINEGKGDDESIFKISQTQFNQLLDRIKSGN